MFQTRRRKRCNLQAPQSLCGKSPGARLGEREEGAGSGQPPTADPPYAMSPGWQAGDWVHRQVPPCPSWGQGSFGQGRPGPRLGEGAAIVSQEGRAWDGLWNGGLPWPQEHPKACLKPCHSQVTARAGQRTTCGPNSPCPTHVPPEPAGWTLPPTPGEVQTFRKWAVGAERSTGERNRLGSPDRSALSHGQSLPSPASYLGTTPSDS